VIIAVLKKEEKKKGKKEEKKKGKKEEEMMTVRFKETAPTAVSEQNDNISNHSHRLLFPPKYPPLLGITREKYLLMRCSI